MNRLADASAAIDQAYRLAPDDPTVKKAVEQLARAGMPRVPAAVKQSASERRQRGDAWLAEGRVVDALREYDEALLLDPSDAEAQAGRIAAMKKLSGR
jgi:tetratricopeptide (TPR) repeat protein